MLSWSLPHAQERSSLTFRVCQGTSAQGPWEILAEGLSEEEFQHRGVMFGRNYWYSVTGWDQNQLTAVSNLVSATAGEVEVMIPEIGARPGESVRIPLAISNAFGIIGFTTWLEYPANLLTVSGWEPCTLMNPPEDLSVEMDSGKFRLTFIGSASAPLSGRGRLYELRGAVPAGAPLGSSGTLTLAKAAFYDRNIHALTVVKTSAKIVVSNQCFAGDVNSDGDVDAGDVLAAGWLAVGRQTFPGFSGSASYRAADVNVDQAVDGADSTLILRITTGKPLNPSSKRERLDYQSSLARAPGAYELRLSDATIVAGATGEIYLSVPDLRGLSSCTTRLNYDERALAVEAVRLTPFAHSQQLRLSYANQAGSLRVCVAGAENITAGGGALVSLTARAIQPAPGTSVIVIRQAKLARQYGENASWNAEVMTYPGVVRVIGTCDVQDAFRLYP